MTIRRELLAFLGLGSTTALAGCFGLFSSDETTPTGTTPEPSEESTDETVPSNFERAQEMGPEPQRWLEREPPEFDFDYGERRFTDPPGEFERVIAKGHPEQRGDRIRLMAGESSLPELATRLRIVWHVADGDFTTTERVADRRVQFSGGRGLKYWYVVGSHQKANTILAVRGASESAVRKLVAEDWTF